MIKKILNSTTIGIWGMKGQGKTFLSSILVNHDINKKYLVYDIVGAYTMKELINNAKYITIKKIPDPDTIDKILFEQWDYRNLVLDVSLLHREEQVYLLDELLLRLYEIKNIGLLIDEVGEVLPEGNYSSKFYSKELERIVRIGRNYNIKPIIFITQRPQQVSKRILDLADYTIVFKLTHHLSREKVRNLLGLSNNDFNIMLLEPLKNLTVGKSIVIDDKLNWKVVNWRVKNDKKN